MSKAIITILLLAAGIALIMYWPFSCKMCKQCGVSRVPVTAEQKLHLVNVLDKKLFDDAHIPGSVCIDMQEIEEKSKDWDKSLPVIVYCSNYMCTASGMTAEKLQELGFKDVYAYEGGMAEWYQKYGSAKVNGPAKERYLEIVLEKPLSSEKKIRTISAEKLHEMLTDANLL